MLKLRTRKQAADYFGVPIEEVIPQFSIEEGSWWRDKYSGETVQAIENLSKFQLLNCYTAAKYGGTCYNECSYWKDADACKKVFEEVRRIMHDPNKKEIEMEMGL